MDENGRIGFLTSKNANSGFSRLIIMPHDVPVPRKITEGITEKLCQNVNDN
jgi:hypothetical protein